MSSRLRSSSEGDQLQPRPLEGVGGTPGLTSDPRPRAALTVRQVLMSVQTFPSPVYFGKQLQTACRGRGKRVIAQADSAGSHPRIL